MFPAALMPSAERTHLLVVLDEGTPTLASRLAAEGYEVTVRGNPHGLIPGRRFIVVHADDTKPSCYVDIHLWGASPHVEIVNAFGHATHHYLESATLNANDLPEQLTTWIRSTLASPRRRVS